MTTAQLCLNGGRVNSDFRQALFDAANRSGLSLNEYVILCAAEALARRGAAFSGVFREGDMPAAA